MLRDWKDLSVQWLPVGLLLAMRWQHDQQHKLQMTWSHDPWVAIRHLNLNADQLPLFHWQQHSWHTSL